LKHKFEYINSELKEIRKHDLHRKMHDSKITGAYITINSKILINLSSNDYLGITQSKISNKQNQSSSRLVSGNDNSFRILEEKLAKHKSQERSLIFPTGYMANLGVISSIIGKNDLVLSDKLNHASLIEACKLTNARLSIFNHNDMNDLTHKIKIKAKRKFIITEGIFSMDGDFSNLNLITEIAEKNNAIVILDDAHGDFVVGKDGKGTANHFGVSKKIDVYISSLSKGLGSFGGYAASKRNIIEFCVNKSKSFIYTSALPEILIHDATKRFESKRERNRKKLWENIKKFSSGLKKIGLNVNSDSQIFPIIVGKEKTTMEFGEYLFKNGIFAQPIRYPTVSRNHARIRISVTARLTDEHIEKSLSVLENAKNKFKINN
jgi:glycine C-acetyltransferase